jgi:nucleoside-diphosphate-sugar epimerase
MLRKFALPSSRFTLTSDDFLCVSRTLFQLIDFGVDMRILISGSSGFLGVNLIDALLADGHHVEAFDIAAPPSRLDPALVFTRADVRDRAAMRELAARADAVVHCAAALPSHPADLIRSVDVDGTATLLAAARAAGVQRFVHVSSTAVYGLPREVPTPEDAPLLPVDPYSSAKVAAERLAEQARQDGMCVPVLRPKTFLGPGRLGLFAMLFQWADDGRHFPVLGSGRVRCQMLDVQDLVAAVGSALYGPADRVNATFNLGAADFTTLRDDFQAVLDEAGHGRRVVGLPATPALLTLRVLAAARLSPVYKRLIHKLLRDSYVDIGRARARLGFEPRYSNADSVLRAYRWWREQGHQLARATGRTHREPWKQGALALVKAAF